MIQSEVFDENHNIRTFPKFKEKAEQVAETINDNWLRVEYEAARRGCVASEQYRRMYDDRDLYPYWQYRGRMDAREREEHRELEGLIFRIGDPEGDKCMPQNGWNCRCEAESVDDDYLIENGLKPIGPDRLKEVLNNNVNEQFRHSPIDGILPKTGSYFELMPNANYGSPEMFGLPDPKKTKKLDGLAAKGTHHLAEIVDEWKREYHVDKNGDLVFQNTKLFSNVRFTAKSLHTIQKHSRGFDNIPETVMNPDEVWGTWDDPKKQLKSVRNYIIFGSTSFVVQTVAGEITDAFAVNNRSLTKYRKGVII